jgi:hypothetical protein
MWMRMPAGWVQLEQPLGLLMGKIVVIIEVQYYLSVTCLGSEALVLWFEGMQRSMAPPSTS